MATKEQMRLATELITNREVKTANEEPAVSLKRVNKVAELTQCSPSAAEVALIDCEGSIEGAVALLLDKPQELVLWSQQGKTRKPKSTSVPATNAPSKNTQGPGRRGESQSQRGRFRRDGTGAAGDGAEHNTGDEKQATFQQGRPKRTLSNKDQNGHFDRTKSHERFGPRGGGPSRSGGPRRYPGKTNGEPDKKEATAMEDNTGGDWGSNNGWSSGNAPTAWGEEAGSWQNKKNAGKDTFPAIGTYIADSTKTHQNEKDDEWKNGPRVFMPSTATNVAPTVAPSNGGNVSSNVNATTSWPSLDNNAGAASNADPSAQQQKPKTFASVAATKKAPPPPPELPPIPKTQSSANEAAFTEYKPSIDQQQTSQEALDMKNADDSVPQWTSSVDWGTAAQTPPPAEPSPILRQAEAPALSHETFGTSAHSLSVNQEYTDHLKSAIGLMQLGQSPTAAAAPISSPSAANYYQQQISQQSVDNDSFEPDKKVEFATGDLPPPVTNTTSYQFGFQFNPSEGIASSAPLNDPWAKQHISSVELDRSMLKNSATSVLTMTSIPTTSSNVSAHYSTSGQQQNDYQRGSSMNTSGAGLTLTDTVSVNFPPGNGGMGNVSAAMAPPATGQQQQQQAKPMYTAATNPSMVGPTPQQQQQHIQHLQQQQQQQQQQQHQQQAAMYHQTSAATAAVPHQFTNYNMPYMYSPVAAAPTLPGTTAEIDRYLLQQYGHQPYTSLDVQLGAMSMGPPTTMAHRNPLESFMDNKYGPPQQQQSVNQGNTGAIQQSNQQQRGPGQSDATMFGGGGHVAPPPGFGMPTAPAQASYMPQPANLQSLFQMPTYHHPQLNYQQHHFMMPNANRMPTSQRPTQTSPPEGNGHQRRHDRGTDSQGYGGGGGGNDSNEHSTGGGGPQSYVNVNNFSKYRPYM